MPSHSVSSPSCRSATKSNVSFAGHSRANTNPQDENECDEAFDALWRVLPPVVTRGSQDCPLPIRIGGAEILCIEEEREEDHDDFLDANVDECSNCRKLIPAEALVCEACGRKRGDADAEDTDGMPMKVVRCPMCDIIFWWDSNFCRNCGAKRPNIHEMMQDSLYEVRFMGRRIDGYAIHVYALSRHVNESGTADNVLAALLHLGASVDQECISNWEGDYLVRMQPLHLAAARGHKRALRALLAAKADPNAKASICVGGQWQEHHTALHEAAVFQTHCAAQYLLRKSANVNSTTFHGLTPLHVAVRHENTRTVRILLDYMADLQAKDSTALASTALAVAVDYGRFPHNKLHWLARRRFADLLQVAALSPVAACELLAAENNEWEDRQSVHEEDVSEDEYADWERAESAETKLAPTSSPQPRVSPAIPRRRSPGPTTRRSQSRSTLSEASSAISRGVSWRELLIRDDSQEGINNWITLMDLAPRAGIAILEALTEVPREQNAGYHPVPRRVLMPPHVNMVCSYQPTKEWQYSTEGHQSFPSWHKELAPLKKGQKGKRGIAATIADLSTAILSENDWGEDSRELVLVNIRVIRLKGILSAGVLEALATTPDFVVFNTLAARAILEHAWTNVASRYYYFLIFFRVVELAVLVAVVWVPPEDLPRWHCWSILALFAHRELFYEVLEMLSQMFVLGKQGLSYFNYRNFLDYLSVFLLLGLVYLSADDARMDVSPTWLAVLLLERWLRLLYAFRAFPSAGVKILPLLIALKPMGGIVFVATFAFASIAHAAMALDLPTGEPHPRFDLLYTSRSLLLGDGEGIDWMLGLGGVGFYGNYYTQALFIGASFLFCVCTMNLFIAVLGEAYDGAQEIAYNYFLRERASICLQCFLRARWPPPSCRKRFQVAPSGTTIAPWSDAPPSAWHLEDPFLASVGIMSITLVVWLAGLALVPAKTAAVSWVTAMCAPLVVLSDIVLRQRPWGDGDGHGDPHHLWICSRASFNTRSVGEKRSIGEETTDECIDLGQSDGGFFRTLRRDGAIRRERLRRQLEGIEEAALETFGEVSASVRSYGERLVALEEQLMEVAQQLKLQRYAE